MLSHTLEEVRDPIPKDKQKQSHYAVVISIILNVVMFAVKYSAYILSWIGGNPSTVIFSGALDSTCDAINQYVNYSWRGGDKEHYYPLGNFRMRAVGVIICSTVNVAVQSMNIQGIIRDMMKEKKFTEGWPSQKDESVLKGMNGFIFGMFIFGMVAKLSMFIWVRTIPGSLNKILSIDHLIDAIGNGVTLTCWSLSVRYASKVPWLDDIGGLLIPILALINYIPLLVQGSKNAAGERADESIVNEIREFIMEENDAWKETFEIESVIVTKDGEGYAVDIDIDVIDEKHVTAELLIDVQLHLKRSLMETLDFNISRVDIDFDDQTESDFFNVSETFSKT